MSGSPHIVLHREGGYVLRVTPGERETTITLSVPAGLLSFSVDTELWNQFVDDAMNYGMEEA